MRTICGIQQLLLVIPVIFLGSGCSAVGFAVGSMIDAAAEDSVSLHVADLEKIEEGAEVEVHRKDGKLIAGEYLGIDVLPPDEYSALYSVARAKDPGVGLLPELGEIVTIAIEPVNGGSHNSLVERSGNFIGFDSQHIIIQRSGLQFPSKHNLQRVRSIVGGNGRRVEGMTLQRFLAEQSLPVMEAVALETTDGKMLVPITHVAQVSALMETTKFKYVGLAGGAVVDLALLLIAIATWDLDMDLGPVFAGISGR